MLRYYITDRHALGGTGALLRNIERLGNDVDIVQLREKDLPARELAVLLRAVLQVAHPSVMVLVNDRADVAIACGAHGVHLRANAVSVRRMRTLVPSAFRISVSCHGIEDVRIASTAGADYALLSPVFNSPGKGAPLGLQVLREAAGVSAIPVLALGGVDSASIEDCESAGAAGIAAIRLFQNAS